MTPIDSVAAYADRPLNPDRWQALVRYGEGVTLDVGCGNGSYVLALRGRVPAFGVDFSRLDAWTQDPVRFMESDATSLPVRHSSVDTLVCFETLEHLADPTAALREYRRACRGRLILTVPNCRTTPGMRMSNIIYGHWADRTHRSFYDVEGLAKAVRDAGFLVVEAGYVNRIDLFPFFGEAFRLPALVMRILRRLLGRWTRPYSMTLLVVAEAPA